MARTDAFYTYAEASRVLGVSRQRVHQLVAAGELATVVRGARRYVSGVSLARHVEYRAMLPLDGRRSSALPRADGNSSRRDSGANGGTT